MPLLNFIKRHSEILCLGGFLFYWFWDAKLSSSFSGFTVKDWMSMANTLATLTLTIVALYGINSWRNEYKNKRRLEVAMDFGEKGYLAMLSIRRVTSPYITYVNPPQEDAENPRLEHAIRTSETRLTLLDQEAESLNAYDSKRYLYKLWLGDFAEETCSKFVRLGQRIQDACDQHVELAGLLPTEKEDFEINPHYKDLERQFNETRLEFSRATPSDLPDYLEQLKKDIDTIVKEHSF
ncbi:hypothetical protein [Halodesulfovibrio spirochaetisodalis]|uniref:Uncharacterized protein n=1 Tax=Halodesulfovibrio spirochaetisodalis TaxID=1560234 RepID=A0A1B7X9V6_9BACT|nr:hypothetical protein [Halodesulfovibrio spirochaetisodalis]OBQ46070.1 hypothetical protein SP90_14320 [Halodesulfovibrio spirochaetisodalis]